MGIPKRWSRINRWTLANIPDEPGAYEVADRSKMTIDIGGSGDLAQRIPEKLRDRIFKGQARFFRFVEDYDPDLAEAELQAEFMARYGSRPKFTVRVQGEAYEILDEVLGR